MENFACLGKEASALETMEVRDKCEESVESGVRESVSSEAFYLLVTHPADHWSVMDSTVYCDWQLFCKAEVFLFHYPFDWRYYCYHGIKGNKGAHIHKCLLNPGMESWSSGL